MAAYTYNLFRLKSASKEFNEIEYHTCLSLYTEALNQFEQIKNYRGTLLSCQYILDMQKVEESPSSMSSSDQTMLDAKVKHSSFELQIIERSFN